MKSPRRLLVTAFEPFGVWTTNASRLCLEQLIPQLPRHWEVVTRIYPVEFDRARPLLEADLAQNFDLSIHLGQAQNTGRIRLESIGLNVGVKPGSAEGQTFALIPGGPPAYQVGLPLTAWAEQLRAEGIPAYVSQHAGTYLCNATLYWARHFVETHGVHTQICFIHVPLDISQVTNLQDDFMTLPASLVAAGVRRLIEMWESS